MNIVVLLVDHGSNQPDDSAESNAIDLSFLPKEYTVTLKYLTMANYEDTISKLNKDDIVINLCDGIDYEGKPGIGVVKLLEKSGLVFTGCSSRNYEWKKSDIKRYNVSTPKYAVLHNTTKFTEKDFETLRYPLIAKPDYNGGSTGITAKSRVTNYQELSSVLTDMQRDYTDIMVEEFIEGREFTVLVCENPNGAPIVFEPMECLFHHGQTFKHYNLKWKDWREITYEPISDSDLQKKIMDFCRNLFVTLNIDSYVRFDLRMSVDGTLYVNDVNPYCGIFYPPDCYGSADLILQNSKLMNHSQFVQHLIKCGTVRQLNSKVEN